ncbi:NlpC/P60 family protein [Xanthobacteraceae bacterium A53D]
MGLPFEDGGRDRRGVDCWGLVRLAFAGRGVDLPSYTDGYQNVDERAEIDVLIGAESAKWPWSQVQDPAEWDVAVFRHRGHACHVGIVIRPGWMLHVMRGIDSRTDDYRTGLWRPRLLGFYRHRSWQ